MFLTKLRLNTRRQTTSRTATAPVGHGFAQSHLTIADVQKQTEYYTEKKLREEKQNSNVPDAPPVPYYRLYRFMTRVEFLILLLGIILTCINALFMPVEAINYGEFISLLIDRSVGKRTTTSSIALVLFGGAKIIVNGTREENREALLDDSKAFAYGCLVIAAIQFVTAAAAVNIFNHVSLRQIERVKRKFFRAVLRQDMAWYDLNTTVNFATKVSDDVDKFREAIGEKVPMLINLFSSFIFAVLISFAYGWKLTLVMLACSPIIIATTAIVARMQSALTERELETYSIAGMISEEVLGSIRTVIAFGGEQKEIERYTEKLAPSTEIGSKKGMYNGIGSGLMWFIIYVSYAISFWYGIVLILNSRHEEMPTYSPATILIIFFSVLQGAQNVGLSTPYLESLASGRAAAAAIYNVLDRKPTIDSLSNKGNKPELKGDMRLVNVEFRYPARSDVKILDKMNFEIHESETVALVGSSGCGKSTVLQMIQRMYDPDKGEVLASGHDLRNINVNYLRRQIGVVGQEPILFAGSIMENIRMGNPQCSDEDIVNAAKEAYCHQFITGLPQGYHTMLGERGAQLSGGQKQRIAIARALVRKPKLLILDEATSALDSHSEAQVQRALDAVAKSRTTVMVSHRLSTVVNADRIVVIEKGRVVEQGTHRELLKLKGHYYQLVLENEPGAAENVQDTEISKKKKEPERSQMTFADTLSNVSSEVSKTEDTKLKEEEKEVVVTPTIWQVMQLTIPEKWLMLMGILAAMGVGSSFQMFAILFGETYGYLESPDEDYIRQKTTITSILFVVVGVYTGLMVFTQLYMFNLSGVRLTARLREAAFAAMLKQEIAWFDNPANGVGSLCARLAADAAAVQGATGARIGAMAQAGATIIIGVLIALYISWNMTLVSLACVPVIIGAVVMESKLMEKGAEKVRQASQYATNIATEAITNIRTVNGFSGEKDIIERYEKSEETARGTAQKNVRFRGCVYALGQTAPLVGYAVALWYGGVLVADKELHYKDVIKVSEALIFGSWIMGQALAFAPNLGAALKAAARVITLLRREPRIFSTEIPSIVEKYVVKGDISYNSVHFRYPTRREVSVLNGLSLKVKSGTRVALVGPSGCGKSTLMQLLQRFYDADKGTVKLDEANIVTDIRLTTLRNNLGIVSQEPCLFNRSIRENIAYGDNSREVPIEEIVNASIAAKVHSFIVSLPDGYDTPVGSRAGHLSGGQKQRIAIARVLVRNPRVLLLDEATSALDARSEKVVQEALDQASVGRTCLIIAHRLATIKNAELICVLDEGVIREQGTHNELIALNGIYAKLYELQHGLTNK